MTPEWIDGGAEFREFVFSAHHETVNGATVGCGGDGIDIGIIDSVYELPEALTAEVDIATPHRFLDTQAAQTRPHGMRVFQFTSKFAPHATYHFYQSIGEDGSIPIGAYEDAIEQAIQDGVDILNISAGNDWDVPVDADPYSRKPQNALSEGITVIAAAGNYDRIPPQPPVNSPAAVDEVVSVGGVITTCPESPDAPHTTPNQGPYYSYEEDESSDDPHVANKVCCGQNGCMAGRDCLSNQTHEPWEGNPRESRGAIDVLAPIQYPFETESGGFQFDVGTSFSAPIVTGVLAEAYGDIRHAGGEIPSPRTAKATIKETAMPLRNQSSRLLDAYSLKSELEASCTPTQPER